MIRRILAFFLVLLLNINMIPCVYASESEQHKAAEPESKETVVESPAESNEAARGLKSEDIRDQLKLSDTKETAKTEFSANHDAETVETSSESTTEETTEASSEPTTEETTEASAEPTTEETTEASGEPATEETTEPTTAPSTEPDIEPTGEPTISEDPAFPTLLQIDTDHIYPGMDSTYEEGYNPSIQNGAVHIIVPLIPTGRLQNDQVYASADVGQGNVPFVIASYEKAVSLSKVATQDGTESKPLYFAEFRIPLRNDRKNGTYPVKLSISGYDMKANAVTLEHTVYVTITDEIIAPPVPTEPPKAPVVYSPPKPTAEPVVYISESIMEPNTAIAGEEFVLTLTLQNSVTTKDVKNMLVSVNLDNLQINLLEKSTVIPIERLKAGEKIQLPLHFSTDPNIKEGKHNLKFHFSYDSTNTLKLSSDANVIINVRQPAELSYDGASLPAKVFQGDTVGMSINLMNTGKSPLYNCRIDFRIDGLQSGGTVFVGEIPAGENKIGRGSLRVSKDILADVKGKILITYEDAFGKEFQKEAEVSTQIAPELIVEDKEKEEKAPNLWWVYILVGLALGGMAGFGIPWLIRDRKQRREDDLRL